jgi:transposase-like protein
MRENYSVAFGLSGEVLPIHPALKPDELLSSWLCRLAIAHNVTPYKLVCMLRQKGLTSDIDRYPDHAVIQALARTTGTKGERVRAGTLQKYWGVLHVTRTQKGPLPWLLPLVGLNRSNKQHGGMQACSKCLAEDLEPYYRLSWRLAFVTACPVHRVRLLDRCPGCLGPIEYVRNASQLKPLEFASLTVCAKCRFDLKKANKRYYLTRVTLKEIAFQEQLVAGLEDKWINLEPNSSVYAHIFFEGLHRILSVLYARRDAVMLRNNLCKQCHIPASKALVSQKPMPAFYKYGTVDRGHLMRMAACLLLDWPRAFITFCSRNCLGSFRWFKGPRYVPYWLWKVVHDHLDESEYLMSKEEFLSAVEYIRGLGLKLTKQNVSSYIGSIPYKRFRRSWSDGSNRKEKLIKECPRCHVTGPQPSAGLSSFGDERFRCVACGRSYTQGKRLGVRHTKETVNTAIRLHQQGRSLKGIARILSVSPSSVQRWLDQWCLSLKLHMLTNGAGWEN